MGFIKFFFFLLNLLALFANSVGRKKVIMHIGPSNTGASNVQQYLREKTAYLDVEGYTLCWPQWTPDNSTLQLENSVFAQCIHDAASEGLSIIISSDKLAELPQSEVSLLAKMFTDYDVYILYVHRETFNRKLSLYNELSHLNLPFMEPFPIFALQQVQPDKLLLENYSNVFGNRSIHIADYYGMAKDNVNTAHVILCEIAVAFCPLLTTDKSPADSIGELHQLLFAPLLLHILGLLEYNECLRDPITVHQMYQDVISKIFTSKHSHMPVQWQPMDVVVDQGHYILKKWEDTSSYYRWHHLNHAANADALWQIKSYKMLMIWEMESDVVWRRWIDKQLEWIREQPYYTSCFKSINIIDHHAK